MNCIPPTLTQHSSESVLIRERKFLMYFCVIRKSVFLVIYLKDVQNTITKLQLTLKDVDENLVIICIIEIT